MQDQDLTKGYCVKLYVHSDGTYSVGDPIALEEGEDTGGESIADLPSALKKVLNVVKSHPVGESDQAQFEAGYGATPKKETSPDLSMPY